MTLRPLFAGDADLAPLLDAGWAVLTPNRRLARAVRVADNARREGTGLAAWSSATIMPLRQFWSEQWQRAVTRGLLPARSVLEGDRQRLLWQRIIEADPTAGFSLLSTARAAELCSAAYEQLALWQVDPRASAWRSWFGLEEDSRSFLQWATSFEAALAAIDALTPEQAQQQLLADIPAGARADLELPPVALLYGDPLPPLHRALTALCPDVRHVDLPPARARVADVLAFADPESELEAAARWCRERLETDPEGRHGVVLQDMQGTRAHFEWLLRREFGCLTTAYDSLPVNFATGFTLDRVALVRDALRILSLYGREVHVEEAVAALQSRFVRPLPLPPERLEQQLQRLRMLARERVPGRILRELLAPLVADGAPAPPWNAGLALDSRGQPLGRARMPGEWLAIFRSLLAAWGWGEGAALDSLEYQQRGAWEEALDAYALLDPITGTLDFDAALAQLRSLLGERQFQPQTTDRALQVLGPLETTGLSFDGLWITGMSAAAWPAHARPNPYLPVALQRQLRMPGADAAWEWERAQRRWQHWQSSATVLQASFVHIEDESEQLASPLLAGRPIITVDTAPAIDPRWLAQGDNPRLPVALEAVPLDADEAARGAVSGQLEAQAACPFKAFAAARLQSEPAPSTCAGLLPWERGTLLHRALYQLFGDFPDRDTLRSATPDERRDAIERAIGEARRGLDRNRRAVVGAAALEVEERRLEDLLAGWLEREAERAEPFTVVEREAARELQLAGLNLRLRIDRIDRFEDGSTLIVDYKSGRPESLTRWFEEPPGRPQLPLYALLEPPAAGITYAVLRRGEAPWRGVAERPFVEGIDSAGKWLADDAPAHAAAMASLRAHWLRSLSLLARDFVDGVNVVAPTRDACRYCGREALCRVGDGAA